MQDVLDSLGQITSELVGAVVSLIALALIFIPLELAFRAGPRVHVHRRPELFLDLTFFFWQHVLWAGAVTVGLASAGAYLDPYLDPHRTFLWIFPWWVQAAVAWILGDLLIYWGHRFQHKVPFLWRFHRVHHTATEVDWIAAFREHPLDGLYTRTLVNLPALLMGFSLSAIAGLLAFRGLWAVFIHANVEVRVGPLKYLMGAPSVHRWHHELHKSGQCNFANLMPLWDILFGTYYEPASRPSAFGVPGHAPVGYLRLMVDPVGLPRSEPQPPLRIGT